MTRRERLKGHRFQVNDQVQAEVRRSCRTELKVMYQASAFGREVWDRLATLGAAEVYRASQLKPGMKDIYRVRSESLLLEGAVGAGYLVATFKSKGRLKARHSVEHLLASSVATP